MSKLCSILLVDDNPDDNFINTRIIKKSELIDPASVIVKENGLEAYQFLVEDFKKNKETYDSLFPPSLILLDINMPKMNGFAFLDKLTNYEDNSLINSVLILMLTSSVAENDRKQAGKYSIVKDYLIKPLTTEKIQEIHDKYLT